MLLRWIKQRSSLRSTLIATFIAAAGILNTGCVSVPQLVSSEVIQQVPDVPEDKAQIVFLNPSNSIAGAFLSEVYKIDNGFEEREILGMAASKMKIVSNVEPGNHMFMCRTLARTHFMKAENLEPGKRYYVLMRFIYANGFQLRPIRSNDSSDYSATNPDFESWKTSTKIVDLMPNTDSWIRENWGEHVEDSYKKYWKEWLEKSDSQRAELTLKSEDSMQ